MDKRCVTHFLALTLAITLSAANVWAHGEAGDQPFLKNMTTAFYDVSISPSEVEIGQPVTVTGKVKVLETWPQTLHAPDLAAVVPVVPRWIAVKRRFHSTDPVALRSPVENVQAVRQRMQGLVTRPPAGGTPP